MKALNAQWAGNHPEGQPRTKRLIYALVLVALTLSGCRMMQPAPEVVVFAAASLTDAFNDLAVAFEEATPGVDVITNYGGSSQLALQLMQGAQADVFASANEAQMHNVVDDGLTAAPPDLFATNTLTVIVPADNPAGITTLADLAEPGVLLVLAVPGVPVREYTDEALANAAADPAYGPGFEAGVLANLASEEDNVRQVVAKVALGEADAGIVYTSDVTEDIVGQVQQIAISPEHNITARYPIAPLTTGRHPDLAEAFIAFVLSEAGQAILGEYGFGPAPEPQA